MMSIYVKVTGEDPATSVGAEGQPDEGIARGPLISFLVANGTPFRIEYGSGAWRRRVGTILDNSPSQNWPRSGHCDVFHPIRYVGMEMEKQKPKTGITTRPAANAKTVLHPCADAALVQLVRLLARAAAREPVERHFHSDRSEHLLISRRRRHDRGLGLSSRRGDRSASRCL